MIVDDLDILRTIAPAKTNAPLVMDANAMLPVSIASQCFKPVTRRNAQVAELVRGRQDFQLASRGPLYGPEFPDRLIIKQSFSIAATETLDHKG